MSKTPDERDYRAILTADPAYRQSRLSPHRITDTIDRIETMSTDSAESTVEERLRVVEEGPGQAGMPRPWTMRSPHYDKPLPMPMRTPSPMISPSPSPNQRRERGNGTPVFSSPLMAASPSPVRVLFPQDQNWLEEMIEGPFEEEVNRAIRSSTKAQHLTVQELFESAHSSPHIASPATKQRLLSVYEQTQVPRSATPLGMADEAEDWSVKPKSLMRQVKPRKILVDDDDDYGIKGASIQRTQSPVGSVGRVTPLSFAERLDSSYSPLRGQAERRATPLGMAISVTKQAKISPSARLASGDDEKVRSPSPVGASPSPVRNALPSLQTAKPKNKKKKKRHSKHSKGKQHGSSSSKQPKDAASVLKPVSIQNHKSGSKVQSKSPSAGSASANVAARKASPSISLPSSVSPDTRLIYLAERGESEAVLPSSITKSAKHNGKNVENIVKAEAKQKTVTTTKGKGRKKAISSTKYRRGNIDDWQVTRRYPVDHFFVPRRFHHYAAAMRIYTAGEWLRKDWKTERRHCVDHFFNPRLFDEFASAEPISLFDWYRMDWKVMRQNYPEAYFVPSLFDVSSGKKMVATLSPINMRAASKSPVSISALSYSEAVFGPVNNGAATTDKRRLSPTTSGTTTSGGFEKKKTRQQSPASYHSRSQHSQQSISELLSDHLSPAGLDNENVRPEPDYQFWSEVFAAGPEYINHDRLVIESVSMEGGGIPDDLVAGLWLKLLGIPMVDCLVNAYPFMLDAAGSSCSCREMIEYDVCRATDDLKEQESLTRILMAYTSYDPIVGYAPGMLKTAMTLRQELTEEQAFAGLVRIYFAWDQRRMVVPSVDGLRESLFVFDSLVRDYFPSLSQSQHLSRMGISSDIFASSWFHALSFDQALDHDVMTWFLLEGRRVLFSLGLGLMAINEQRIRHSQDPEEIAFFLNHDICNGHPPHLIIDFAHRYYQIDDDAINSIILRFKHDTTESIESWNDEELESIRRESVGIMRTMAKLATRVEQALTDRERLLLSSQSGRRELGDLHRLCYEQAYRLHLDDARLIDLQFNDTAQLDISSETSSNGEMDDTEGDVEELRGHTERVEQELVNVKMRYAEAMAELDSVRNELAVSQRSSKAKPKL
jgi:hypothetical protein